MTRRFLFSFFLVVQVFSMTCIAQDSPESLLEELELNASQRSAIQSVLLGGMQSLKVINAELAQYDSQISFAQNNELLTMRNELLYQRLQLAESMAMEIIDLLSEEQRSKLNFRSLIDSLPTEQQDQETLVREFEI